MLVGEARLAPPTLKSTQEALEGSAGKNSETKDTPLNLPPIATTSSALDIPSWSFTDAIKFMPAWS